MRPGFYILSHLKPDLEIQWDYHVLVSSNQVPCAMKKSLPGIFTVFSALLLLCGHAVASGDEPATSEPSTKSAPGVVTKVTNAIQRGASAAATGIEHGVKAAASGVERGAKAAGRGIEHGAQATARGIEKGATATGKAAHKVADKIGGSSESPASAPATDK